MERTNIDIQRLSESCDVRRLTHDDIDSIYALSEKNELFYRYHPPFVTRESIADDMRALPPGKRSGDKYYVGFFDGEMLVAVLDLILDYPKERTAYIGLFMMERSLQGRGIGTRLVSQIASGLKGQGYANIRLAIDRGNPQSAAFWKKNGFQEADGTLPESPYIPMERNYCS